MLRIAPIFLYFLLLSQGFSAQQIANFVSNGSFEKLYTCNGASSPITWAKNWLSIDSASFGGGVYGLCNSKIPTNVNGWQFPLSGQNYIICTFFWLPNSSRGYPKNRLKQTLNQGKTYCVRFHINITNMSPRGIDGFGAYFGGSAIDTITKCTIPLTYITPQVKNPIGNIISDTLNWVPITGTFVATGNEKYLLLGNFLSNAGTSTAPIMGPFYPENWCDVLIDDVSCIEMDVAAYAGPDKWITPGDSVYLGRESDFAIDPYCFWYKLPNATTAIDTTSGIWVKPSSTSTYVVRQELECNTVKWDTVVVYQNAVGLSKIKIKNEELIIGPNPSANEVILSLANESLPKYFKRVEILDMEMKVIKEIEISEENTKLTIITSDIANGIYALRLMNKENEWEAFGKLAVQR